MIVVLPVGSLEPHGPHLPLGTDALLSSELAERSAKHLRKKGYEAWVAPMVPYGVTECAAGFPGVVSLEARILTPLVSSLIKGFLVQGVSHVCVVNNHLEPGHDAALRAAIEPIEKASYACPLIRKFARTLSDEFKSGKCHAGQYETSLVLAAKPELVNEKKRAGLPFVDVSLSEKLRDGVSDFREMGMDDAYAGAPTEGSAAEGEELYQSLVAMVETLVEGALPLA